MRGYVPEKGEQTGGACSDSRYVTQLQTESQARPSIGDILLAHGFVGEEELAAAIVVQASTGQPLGQILVEAGAITRLELASALAEQWSDQDVSITPLPRPRPRPPGSYGVAMPQVAEHISLNESIYLGRLHDAVADLGRRVGAVEPLLAQMERRAAESFGPERIDELNLRISGLAERLEATLARMTELEATLNTTADQVEAVTGGVERAFTELQAGGDELAQRLAALGSVVESAPTRSDLDRLGASVAELAARPEADPLLEGRIEELSSGLEHALGTLDLLSASIDRLASRPEADPALAGRLDVLEPRLDEVATLLEGMAPATHLDELRTSVGSLTERLDAPPDTAALDELSARIDELGRRADDDVLALRVDELEARLGADGGALQELRAAAEELAARPAGDPELAARLSALGTRVDELVTAVAAPDPEVAGRVEELGGRLAELAAQVEAVATSTEDRTAIEQLRGALDDLAAAVAARDPEVAGRIAELAGRVEAMASWTEDRVAIEELREAVAELAGSRKDDELDVRVGELEARLGADGGALQELRAAAEELAARPAGDPELAARLSALGNRVDELAAAGASPDPEVAGRVEELNGRLAELTGRLEAVAASTDDHTAIEELRGALDELAGSRTDDELAVRVGELEARLGADGGALQELRAAAEELAARPAGDPELAARLSALGNRVDELAVALTRQEPDGPTREQLEELRLDAELRQADIAARLGGLAERLGAVEAGAGAAGAEPVDLGPALEDVRRELDARLRDAITHTDERARVAADAAQAWQSERALLEARLDDLSARIDGMPRDDRAATAAGRAAPAAESPADDIERMRMAIERLGLSIGEHDRALAELMRSRGVTQRLDELSARIDEVQGNGGSPAGARLPGGERGSVDGGSADGGSDVRALTRRLEHWESSLEADREKLLTRLERMASAIDWRLQRLEANGETTAA